MTDVFTEILSTVSFNSAVYFKHRFCGTWGMDMPMGQFAQFHVLSRGRCEANWEGQRLLLEMGDIIIFPSGLSHKLRSHAEATCVSGPKVLASIQKGEQVFEDGPEQTHLICGHYDMDRSLLHPLLVKLPDVLLIKSSEYGRFDMINALIEMLIEEMEARRPGYTLVSRRLAEALFISVIRHYYLRQSERRNNMFRDQMVYQAVELIHAELSADWKIATLAKQMGVSRTLFIDRFKKAVGEPPMRYITNWRLTKARSLIKNTDHSLAIISEEVGYRSLAAFNRAFSRQYAISPGKYRRSTMVTITD